MFVNSVLASKVTGKLIKNGGKVVGKKGLQITAPTTAVHYDILTGSGKKGDYQQYVFKNAKDKLVQIFTRYENNGSTKDVITDYGRTNGVLNINRQTIENCMTTNHYISMLPQQLPNGELIASKSFMISSPKGDKGGIDILKQGKKPIGISFNYNYDGTKTKINYKNTLGQKLNITKEESRYLPFIPRRYVVAEQDGQMILTTSDFTTEDVQKKINLAQIIQEKLHDIEGILPRAKAVEAKDLHVIKTSGMTPEQYLAEKGFLPQGENLGNGQINIVTSANNQSDGVVILDLLSHEVQHAADYIKMYRGGEAASDEALKRVGITLEEWNKSRENEFTGLDINEYIQKVIDKKGLVKKGTPEYEEAVNLYEINYRTPTVKGLESLQQHNELPLEKRAIERELQQINFYNQIVQKLVNFLNSLLI